MDMSETRQPLVDDVDLLLANARLRDELEPYRDDSIDGPATETMPLRQENEYLASILAWERAPALPIASWFTPRLEIPSPAKLSDDQLRRWLWRTIDRLYSQRIVLRFTDHLSDRELYRLIYRDILPCCEKKVDLPGRFVEWRCVEDTETWLTYYADDAERSAYRRAQGIEPPPSRQPRFRRILPGG